MSTSTALRLRGMSAAAALLVACHFQPSPIPLQGARSEIAALEGTWEGNYTGAESGRYGVITFIVQAGKDTAYGDVLMETPRGQEPVTAEDVRTGVHATHSRAADLLRITFVTVRRGVVEGVLEPYVAPDCSCVVTTTFKGSINGDAIKGDYLTTGLYGLRQTGKWSVRRKVVA